LWYFNPFQELTFAHEKKSTKEIEVLNRLLGKVEVTSTYTPDSKRGSESTLWRKEMDAEGSQKTLI